MPIDVSEPFSDGWWLHRCMRKLLDPKRQARLALLDAWRRGDPPLPTHAEQLAELQKEFIRLSRTNFAEMIVRAVRERMRPVGVLTSGASGAAGDEIAWDLWKRAGLPVESSEAIDTSLGLGDAYVIVGWDDERGEPVATAEDPRDATTIHDPAQQRIVRAGVKVFHDDDAERDLAYLYLPGRVRVAVRSRKRRGVISWSPAAWDWSDEVDEEPLGGALPDALQGEVVIRRLRNRRGVSEFEEHLDLLARINNGILRRLVILAHQAHKSRALKQTAEPGEDDPLPDEDENGNPIDYDAVFRDEPGAFWILPPGVEIWESGQAQLDGVLNAVKDDILQLAAVSSTPLSMFTPDAATQSAEGASFQREGLSYRTEDRIARVDDEFAHIVRLLLLYAGHEERADLHKIRMDWAPVERHSLSEQGQAWSQLDGLPFVTKVRRVLQVDPNELARIQTERQDDAIAAAVAAAQARPAGAAAPARTAGA